MSLVGWSDGQIRHPRPGLFEVSVTDYLPNLLRYGGVHNFIIESIHRVQVATEIISALIICVGVAIAAGRLVGVRLTAASDRQRRQSYQGVRLKLSRSLAMALEFQLAADVLATTMEPTWDQLGRLGVIAVIRTFLNYFIAREIDEEERNEQSITYPAKAA